MTSNERSYNKEDAIHEPAFPSFDELQKVSRYREAILTIKHFPRICLIFSLLFGVNSLILVGLKYLPNVLPLINFLSAIVLACFALWVESSSSKPEKAAKHMPLLCILMSVFLVLSAVTMSVCSIQGSNYYPLMESPCFVCILPAGLVIFAIAIISKLSLSKGLLEILQTPPPDLSVEAVNKILHEIDMAVSEPTNEYFEISISKTKWKGKLTSDMACFVSQENNLAVFAKPVDVLIKSRGKDLLGKGMSIKVDVNTRTDSGGVSITGEGFAQKDTLAKIAAWQAKYTLSNKDKQGTGGARD